MRATPASLVGLTLLSGLANAQSAYDNICSTAPVGEQDVEPGIVATYECETWHHTGHYAQSSVTATTPEICASECAKRSPEGPCTWYTNTCYFYNAGAPTVAAVAPDSEAVSINTRKDWNKLKVAYDTLEADYNTCESDKSVLNSQLATCQANLGTGGPPGGSGGPPGGSGGPPGGSGGPPGGSGGPPGGSGGPPGGSGGPPSSIPLSVAACPGSTNALITHGGRDWKLVCKKTTPGPYDGTGTNHGAPLSREECVNACARDSQCNWCHWNEASRGCWTYGSSRTLGDFTKDSIWDIYVKV